MLLPQVSSHTTTDLSTNLWYAVEHGASRPIRRLRDDERIRAFGLLHEAHRRLDRAFNGSLEQSCGISGPFFEVLLRIGRSPGGRLNMTELACQLGLTSGGTTRLVDRVVTAGLVERESCPSDRRVQWVVLSGAGAAQARRGARDPPRRTCSASSSIGSTRTRSSCSSARSTSCAPSTSSLGEHALTTGVPCPAPVRGRAVASSASTSTATRTAHR